MVPSSSRFIYLSIIPLLSHTSFLPSIVYSFFLPPTLSFFLPPSFIPFFLSFIVSSSPSFLPPSLSSFLPFFPPFFLPIFLPFFLPIFLPTSPALTISSPCSALHPAASVPQSFLPLTRNQTITSLHFLLISRS